MSASVLRRRVTHLAVICTAFILLASCRTDVPYVPPEGIDGTLYVQRGYTGIDLFEMASGERKALDLPQEVNLDGVVDLSCLPDQQRFVARARLKHQYYLFSVEGELLQEMPLRLSEGATDLTVSLDGTIGAYLDRTGELVFEEFSTGVVRRSGVIARMYGQRPTWVGETKVLVLTDDSVGGYVAWLVDSDTLERLKIDEDEVVCSPYRASTDSAICSSQDGSFFEMNELGERRPMFRRGSGMIRPACWSPDMRWLAYSRRHDRSFFREIYGLYVLDTETTEETQVSVMVAYSCFWIE